MTLFRVNHQKNYTVVNNYICTDNRLSWKAKGIWLYAFSRPDDWTFHLNDLVNQSCDGEKSVKAGLKELEKTGYLRRSQKQAKNGKFEKVDWEFHEKPSELKIKVPQDHFRLAENRLPEKATLLNTDTLLSTEKETLTPPSHSVSQEAKDCVCFFSSFHKKEGTHITDMQRKQWTKEFVAMHEEDKVAWDEIMRIIEFAQTNEFWQSRTLTAKNLRENARTIRYQMKPAKKGSNAKLQEKLISGKVYKGKINGKESDFVCTNQDDILGFRCALNNMFYDISYQTADREKAIKSLINRFSIEI